MHCATFYQTALRHELLEDVTPPSRVDSSVKDLMAVMFCSDLPVKRCEGDRALLAFVLNAVCESLKIRTINCDVLVLNLVCHFLAEVLPVLGVILK